MNQRLKLDRRADPDATVDGRAFGAAAKVKPRCGKVELVDCPERLTEGTQSLLRIRLRAAALISLSGLAAFLIYGLLPIPHLRPRNDAVLGFQIFTILVLALCTVWVWRPRPMFLFTLRVAEGLVFGVPAMFFVLITAFEIQNCASGPSPHAANPLGMWMLLIFTYSLFIPNSWKRAFVVNTVISAMGLGTIVAMCLAVPEVGKLYDSTHLVPLILTLLITLMAATFGAGMIGSLRQEVFEAKQLGQYRLGRKIGAGGMGEVYLAEHEMLKRPCAIKVIRPSQAADPMSMARFEREVMAMAQLSHWNTVEIFDYGRTADGTFYYVMEYLPGLSFNDLVEKHGPLPAERVIHLLRQVCDALAEAHSLGMLHRDIKPGNVFAALRGGVYDVAKLLDFGLVKPIADQHSAKLTQDGVVTGTPFFISPEQATSRPVDVPSDLYSLGAVAYFLLTGRPPFEGDSVMNVLIAHARDPVTPPSQHRPDIPDDLERVVLRCLEKKPEDRYPDARQLQEALNECHLAGRWDDLSARMWWNEQEPNVGPSQKESEETMRSAVLV